MTLSIVELKLTVKDDFHKKDLIMAFATFSLLLTLNFPRPRITKRAHFVESFLPLRLEIKYFRP